MTEDHGPEDFDWVSAQADCSASLMFERLRDGVRGDVARRNGLENREDDWAFELHDDDEGFEVSRFLAGFGASRVGAFVRFERAGRRIHVHGDGVDVDFTTVVALDSTGACRFVVGEAMYSEWEIRRMALEALFFEEPASD